MSAGAYLLVKFNDREKLLPAIQSLNGADGISRRIAIDGDYSLLLKLKDKDESVLDRVRRLDGFSSVLFCELRADNEPDDSLIATDYSYSYVFIETEKDRKKSVQQELSNISEVAFCSLTTGDADLVALVKGQNFSTIDRVVNNQMRVIDGVVRLKQDRVIHLDRV